MDLFAPWHIVIIVAIILLFFGAKKIPELAKGIGEGMTEFKKATQQHVDEGERQNSERQNTSEPSQSSETTEQVAEKPREEAKSE
jgi:sec-independent protein translocase protein TatA